MNGLDTRKLSFTGTRAGMTVQQRREVLEVWQHGPPTEIHHGVCIGSDEEFHNILLRVRPKYWPQKVYMHWPTNRSATFLPKIPAGFSGTVINCEPKPYLERNGDIVRAGTLLLATPAEFKEELRSGTWATIRLARRLRKSIVIVWPDGTSSWET